MSDAANETMAVETAAVRVGPAGQISPSEELITLTEATRHLPKVEGKKVPVCILCGDGAANPIPSTPAALGSAVDTLIDARLVPMPRCARRPVPR
jgi:hypothetical protein